MNRDRASGAIHLIANLRRRAIADTQQFNDPPPHRIRDRPKRIFICEWSAHMTSFSEISAQRQARNLFGPLLRFGRAARGRRPTTGGLRSRFGRITVAISPCNGRTAAAPRCKTGAFLPLLEITGVALADMARLAISAPAR
jgi:hypothetical protein